MTMLRAVSVLMWALALSANAAPALAQSSLVGSGTGFFINAEGWAVTNAHVLDGCTKVSVSTIGNASDWIVDRQNDVAAIRVPQGVGKPYLRIRGSSPRLGDDVAAFGYPFSDFLSDSIKVTTGNINSLIGAQNDTRFLQISTPIQPGNSGGPVVDSSGKVVGIATKVLSSRGDYIAQNVNFALRSGVLESFLRANGLTYQSVTSQGATLGTADLADLVSPAVIHIQCFGQRQQSVPDPMPIPRIAKRTFRTVNNHDAIGFDYETLRSISLAQCQQACERDRTCSAATYNKRERFCFLKKDAALVVGNADAVAYIDEAITDRIFVSTFVMAAGRDMAGGDYRAVRNTDFIKCYLECEADRQCRAFAYVRKQKQCWLKNRLGNVTRKSGVDLGLR